MQELFSQKTFSNRQNGELCKQNKTKIFSLHLFKIRCKEFKDSFGCYIEEK